MGAVPLMRMRLFKAHDFVTGWIQTAQRAFNPRPTLSAVTWKDKNLRKLSIIAIAVATAITGLTPAWAAPMGISPAATITQSDVLQVQNKKWIRRDARETRRDRRDVRRSDRDRRGWHNGQRGQRQYRSGYRRHSDGWWYPLAAFGAGAIIGGAISSQPTTSYGNNHVQWCANRYRTYRAYDNTYVPYAGARAKCVSPY